MLRNVIRAAAVPRGKILVPISTLTISISDTSDPNRISHTELRDPNKKKKEMNHLPQQQYHTGRPPHRDEHSPSGSEDISHVRRLIDTRARLRHLDNILGPSLRLSLSFDLWTQPLSRTPSGTHNTLFISQSRVHLTCHSSTFPLF